MTLEEAVGHLDNPETDAKVVASICQWLCSIKRADLAGALEVQASYYAYFASLHAAARALESARKSDFEQVKANSFSTLTKNVKDGGGGKSATAASAVLAMQKPMMTVEKTYRDAVLVSARYYGLLHALDHRRDMLVQLSARQRAELDQPH